MSIAFGNRQLNLGNFPSLREARSDMEGAFMRRVLVVSATLLSAALWAAPAVAQSAVITGKVTGEAGQPLGGASVGIPDLGVGSISSTDGSYTFTVDMARASGRTVNVVARF